MVEAVAVCWIFKLKNPKFTMRKHTKAQLFKKVGLFRFFLQAWLFLCTSRELEKPDFYELNLLPKSRAFWAFFQIDNFFSEHIF